MIKKQSKKESNTQNWFEKIIKSSWFGLTCIVLTLAINGIVATISKDLKWAVITIVVLIFLLLLMWFLSFLMRKEREDIMHSIIQEDGLLDDYLKTKIDCFNKHGNCLISIQKECEKRMEQNFLKQEYEKIKFFNFKEILELEKSVANEEVWIITDNIIADKNNIDVYDAVGSNISNGTIYKYFYNQQKGAEDAKEVIKRDLAKRFNIDNIDTKIDFIQITSDYNALLTIAKDVIILQPDNLQQRRAFLCIFASENFKIAFYRELNEIETNILCDDIRKLLPK